MAYADLKNCKIITAFITPFHEDGSINFEAIPDLIEHLLAHHTDGILLAGTTAESPTRLTMKSWNCLRLFKRLLRGRVPLIAGVGTNETRDSIRFVKEVDAFGGFAAGLAIVPITINRLKKVCISTLKRLRMLQTCLLLSIISQDGVVVEMTPETMLRLAEHPNIIGVKECTSLANT